MVQNISSLSMKGRVFRLLVALLLFATVPTLVWAADEGYLNALKSEANSDRSSMTPTVETDDGRPPPRTDDQPQMEEWLKKNYPGSYTFYKRMSETKRRAVYRVYRSGAEITEIREKINELIKQ